MVFLNLLAELVKIKDVKEVKLFGYSETEVIDYKSPVFYILVKDNQMVVNFVRTPTKYMTHGYLETLSTPEQECLSFKSETGSSYYLCAALKDFSFTSPPDHFNDSSYTFYAKRGDIYFNTDPGFARSYYRLKLVDSVKLDP
jgi:hypothetical protein